MLVINLMALLLLRSTGCVALEARGPAGEVVRVARGAGPVSWAHVTGEPRGVGIQFLPVAFLRSLALEALRAAGVVVGLALGASPVAGAYAVSAPEAASAATAASSRARRSRCVALEAL